MAACNFNIAFSGEAEVILNKARSAVETQGGRFSGDLERGSFHLSVLGSTVAGSYTVAGKELNIIIDDKPFLIPCSTIEGFLKSKLT